MHKRQGWIRLGIVISVLFLASFHSFLYLQYKETGSSITASSLDKATPDEWKVVGVESKFFSCSAVRSTGSCTLKVAPYSMATLIPLLVLWGLIPALLAIYRWVRAGFKGKP